MTTSVTAALRSEDAAPAKSGDRGGIQSLERAAAILDAVVARPQGVSLAELSVGVGLHTSTAFHLIRTLVSLGFLSQNAADKRYRIGSRLFSLAAGALDENALLSLVTPVLERLSASTGYAAHLAVRSGDRITVVARTAATGLLQLSDRIGATRPAHATAIGKVLLSEMPADDLDLLLETLPLPPFTDKTITEPKALLREMDKVRRQGAAYDDCEFDADIRCVAVPVYDFAGRCAGAMGLSGPVWRLSAKRLEAALRALAPAAAELSVRLGHDAGKDAEAAVGR